jgi:hypothetical protein
MTPLQSFTVRAEDIRRGVMDGKIPLNYSISFTAEEIAAVSQELAIKEASLETTTKGLGLAIKNLENLYSELAPTRLPVLRAHPIKGINCDINGNPFTPNHS